MLINDRFNGVYASINAEGIVSVTVPEGTSGAILSEYEFKRNGEVIKGSKWVKPYNKISGFITDIKFFEGKFGEQVNITIKDREGEIILTLSKESKFLKDILKKLPNVDFSKEVIFAPFSFQAKGSNYMTKGVTLYQDNIKIKSFFYDEDGNAINGLPVLPKKIEEMSSDDKILFKIETFKFLKNYTETMVLEKIEGALAFNTEIKNDVEEEISVDDIPFDNVEPTVE